MKEATRAAKSEDPDHSTTSKYLEALEIMDKPEFRETAREVASSVWNQFRTSNGVTDKYSERDDLEQEIYSRFPRAYRSFDHNASLKTLLFSVAQNACRDAYRRASPKGKDGKRRRAEKVPVEDAGAAELPHLSLAEVLRQFDVKEALEALLPEDSEVVRVYLNCESLRETGRQLGISAQTALNRFKRIRIAMTKVLTRDDKS